MAKKPKVNPASAEPTVENRRARHDYTIHDTLEVGIKLHGSEVKAVRAGRISLGEGYVTAELAPLGLHLHNATIGDYDPAGPFGHAQGRIRTLLAHKREIEKLFRQTQQKGFTLVPLKLYWKHGYAKLLIGLGEGRGKADKRHAITEREQKRDMDRAMSKRMKF
ncbi:MAG: SsrA-binding protein SmpB [Planctomycetota bacterium]